jgi:hypothetical protein
MMYVGVRGETGKGFGDDVGRGARVELGLAVDAAVVDDAVDDGTKLDDGAGAAEEVGNAGGSAVAVKMSTQEPAHKMCNHSVLNIPNTHNISHHKPLCNNCNNNRKTHQHHQRILRVLDSAAMSLLNSFEPR